jgi:selenide, water dikinase
MSTADDAAVYRVRDDLAVAFTVDYFTPIVDDPYDFGAIAAANAMSDCYAMGVTPSIALNIVGFPARTLPMFVLDRILKGGSDKTSEAKVSIIGGHTIDDPEPKYGMAVVGFTHPDAIVTNAGARKGDLLVLTKPLGIGILTTGIKQGVTPASAAHQAIEQMKTLNRNASLVMMDVGVDACTDVTGFGLLGHLWEMCTASKVGASVRLADVPVIPEAWKLARADVVPGGAYSNREYVAADVTFELEAGEVEQLVLCDPQTSGGLLMAVDSDKLGQLIHGLRGAGTLASAVIGEITEDLPGRIRVVGNG